MEKLQDLSQSELQELLDNAERVESMALESDEIQNIQLEREMALASNRSLAEQNLDVKPRLESQKELLVERYSQLEAVQDVYRRHCALRDGMVGQVSPEALFSRLQTEGAKTEAESESLAEEFLEGSLPLDSFLERFLALRSLAHTRRVRTEKLQDVLRQRSEGAADSAPSAAASSSCAAPDPAAPAANHQPQPGSQAPTAPHGYQAPPQPGPSSAGPPPGPPYAPYPVSPPIAPVAAAGASTPPVARFPPYPSPGSCFSPVAGYTGPRPAFGPAPSPGCPYPAQQSQFPLPAPHPGSAFGQYPPGGPAPYPASYSYGGYSYPAGGFAAAGPAQSPTGRPHNGVPQQYS